MKTFKDETVGYYRYLVATKDRAAIYVGAR